MTTFSNTTGLSFPDLATVSQQIMVSGLSGFVTSVSITLEGLSHTVPGDLDLLLVSPDGTGYVFMSDAGSLWSLANVTVTFTDGATAGLPDEDLIVAGTYLPTNNGFDDWFTGYGGTPIYPVGGNSFASVFGGTNPNGAWTLYVTDDVEFFQGSLTGWSIAITTAPPPVLNGLSATVTFAENLVNDEAQLLDADVTLSHPGGGTFAGGSLVVSGLLAEDVVSLRHSGNASGQIGLAGNVVSYGGVAIGTVSGGNGIDLTVSFNGDATTGAVEALIEALTYANSSDAPTASRVLTVTVTDSVGIVAIGDPKFSTTPDATSPFSGMSFSGWTSPTFADIDGDGRMDMLVGTDSVLRFFIGDTNGGFVEQFDDDNPLADIANSMSPFFIDIDGDGDEDLIVGSTGGVPTRLFVNDGNGGFAEQVRTDPFFTVESIFEILVGGGDIDGDGTLELVSSQGGMLRTFTQQPNGDFTELMGADNPFAGISLSTWMKPVLADIDGDGRLDLAIGTREGTIALYLQQPDGSFGQQTGADNPFDGIDVGLFADLQLVDLDGDGDLDLVVGNSGSSTIELYLHTNTASTSIQVNVTAENDAPVVDSVIAGQSVDEDTAWSFAVPATTFSDPDGDVLTLSATQADGSPLPVWLSFDAATRTFSGTPPQDWNGKLVIRVSADDGMASTGTTFTLTVDPVNDAPVVSAAIPDQSSPEDTAWSFTVPAGTFSDPDGDVLVLTATLSDGSALPAWLSFDAATRTFFGTPPQDWNGKLDLVVTATDPDGENISAGFTLTVDPVNDAPHSLALSASSVAENLPAGTVVGVLSAIDPDGDALSYALSSNPGGFFEIVGNELRLTRPLDYETATNHAITVTATDSSGAIVSLDITIQVDDVIDVITGGPGDDTITGGKGADLIDGGGGNDLIHGRNGNDTVIGGDGNDKLIGGNGDDVLEGGDGNDRLEGRKGNDTLFGGDGDDILEGGAGADRLDGGDGIDTASYVNATRGVVASLWKPADNRGTAKGDSYHSIENLTGSKHADRLVGDDGANVLTGGKGADILIGRNGDDTLIGGKGKDDLRGGSGEDILIGGAGKDTLTGGKGADTFVFRSVNDSPSTKKGWDVITDFRPGQGDRIDLSAIDAKTGKGNQAFTFIGKDAFSGTKGELRFDGGKNKTFVYADVNGDGKADFRIELTGKIDLKQDDFVL